MASPHDIAFRSRPHILALVLAGAVGAVVIDPGSDRADKLSDALSIALVSALGYGTMRTFVWLVVRPLTDRLPRLVRGWGLVWFYGAIPLSLLGLYLGSSTLHAATPSAGPVAFVVAASASMAAGAFAAIRANGGRLTPGWSGP